MQVICRFCMPVNPMGIPTKPQPFQYMKTALHVLLSYLQQPCSVNHHPLFVESFCLPSGVAKHFPGPKPSLWGNALVDPIPLSYTFCKGCMACPLALYSPSKSINLCKNHRGPINSSARPMFRNREWRRQGFLSSAEKFSLFIMETINIQST